MTHGDIAYFLGMSGEHNVDSENNLDYQGVVGERKIT